MSESAEEASPQAIGDQTRRFSAFISYSHADERFAKRLHRALETYRLPRLAGADPSRRLKAAFRDSDELAAAFDLTAAVREAIAQSDFLIVVCSATSAKSEWVGREIEFFRNLHGDAGILAVITEGEIETAFHPALHGRTGGPLLEPLAADFRRDGGGRKLALLKLVAVLAGVRLDELIHRDGQRRIRQTFLASGAVLTTATVIAALALVATSERRAAEQERSKAGGLVSFMDSGLRSDLQSAGRLDVLSRINREALDYFKDNNR